MSSPALLQPEPQPILACTVSRDVQLFDLLIEDMETAMGEQWGDLGFGDCMLFLEQPEAEALQFLAIALDAEDEASLDEVIALIVAAKARDIRIILVTEDVSPTALHKLLKAGGDEFVPYPLPDGELAQAIKRVTSEPEEPEIAPSRNEHNLKAKNDRSGVLIPVQGMAGGTGATTFACNLAYELSTVEKEDAPRVLLIDFDLQYGSVGTYLDVDRREAVMELITDTEAADEEAFMQATLSVHDKLYVLTSPPDIMPLDIMGPPDVERLLEIALANFDYVVVDMPTTLVEWTQTILEKAHVYFALLEIDMRSAQNTLRLKRALQSEDLPFDKLRFILNRAPGFTDLNGKARIKRLADSLGISIDVTFPDGGKQIMQANDHGQPLSSAAPKNALRKEIAKLAKSIHDVNVGEASVSTKKKKRK
ncbi:AAA family ATPase [Marivivens sp. LCG002]|uniref:AAA family ATPase n=1 Tax=Marivivens sp. LCG002 TaxID=3051171 RepID=UPI0025552C7A|nr:AAA family ATPase [Marivivens sp. LCG002]WIV50079.1 AAA family ATPase [Marivivens sp. LCG002]